LFKELRGLSIDELGASLSAIPYTHWFLCAGSAILAYLALAGYDALALSYLKHRINFVFITLTSFTTYALSHNLGASVLSGSIIRYRAYSSKGMSGLEIGQLIAFCSFTFALGTILLTGLVLTFEPSVGERFINLPATDTLRLVGIFLLVAVAAYVYGSWKQFRPLTIGKPFSCSSSSGRSKSWALPPSSISPCRRSVTPVISSSSAFSFCRFPQRFCPALREGLACWNCSS